MAYRFKHYLQESFDTIHPYKQTGNEVEEHDYIRDENDRPIGVAGRKIHHEFDVPNSNDVVRVTHDIKHSIDDYDPKNPHATSVDTSFTRRDKSFRPENERAEVTYQKGHGGRGAAAVFSTVSHITKGVLAKHGHGETTLNMSAENSRVRLYGKMIKKIGGVDAGDVNVVKHPDSHPGAGHSALSVKVPGRQPSGGK